MKSGDPDIWKSRYRDLEQQFESLLINVATTLREIERTRSDDESKDQAPDETEPKILKVVKVTSEDSPYLYCVANGANMEYKFELFANNEKVQDTGFSRLNSVTIHSHNINVADTCVTTVRSDYMEKRYEVVAQTQVKWRSK